jgi:glycosyltransferase involved in cell wall biosynthesis
MRSRLNVLAIVQAWDTADPVRGFVVRWMRAMAERVDRLEVLALQGSDGEPVPGNLTVTLLSKTAGEQEGNRLGKLVRWHRELQSLLGRSQTDVIFTHMSPRLTVLVSPYARPRRIPVVQWFAHPSWTVVTRIAHRCASRIVTSLPTAYKRMDGKVSAIGQGIDTELFSPTEAGAGNEIGKNLLVVGRIAPVKHLATLVEALALLRKRGTRVGRAIFLGPVGDDRYLSALKSLVKERNLGDTVEFAGPVGFGSQLVGFYRRTALHVNLTGTGSSDKSVLEALACGVPSLACNEGYRETLGPYAERLLFRESNAAELADKIERLLDTRAEWPAIASLLRRRVIERHGLDGLIGRLVGVMHEART